MQSNPLTPQLFCLCPVPNHFHFHHLRRKLVTYPSSSSFHQSHFTENPFLPPSTTFHTCKTNIVPNKKHKKKTNPAFLEDIIYDHSDKSNKIRAPHDKNQGIKALILLNMWWAGLKAALGQRINFEAIVCSAAVFTKEQHLAIPHVSVPDIRYVDWAELNRRGFKGVVFDKDNTITAPYSLSLWGPIRSSLEQCKSVFGDDVAIFSNSSGLYEYDPDCSKARTLESAIGIEVLRHRVKKPAGTAEEIEEHFGCESSQLIMVGDRPFTDIVYGNRNGFLTILTEPLTLVREPFIVQQVRKLENYLVGRWCKKGLRPTNHNLLPDALQCVKDSPSL